MKKQQKREVEAGTGKDALGHAGALVFSCPSSLFLLRVILPAKKEGQKKSNPTTTVPVREHHFA